MSFLHGFKRKNQRRKEYVCYQNMVARCENPNHEHFSYYGGRGISVCKRWRESFVNFIADMGEIKGDACFIERIDNNGAYSPENCKWATRKEQGRNKRNNRWFSFNGQTEILADWSRILNTSSSHILRMLKNGKSFGQVAIYYLSKQGRM